MTIWLCCSGDVFVLDAGEEVFEWHGSETDCFERKQALEMALRIKTREKAGRAKVLHVCACMPVDT